MINFLYDTTIKKTLKLLGISNWMVITFEYEDVI